MPTDGRSAGHEHFVFKKNILRITEHLPFLHASKFIKPLSILIFQLLPLLGPEV